MGAASDRVGRVGIHGVGLLVVGDLRWKFHEQHHSDWGIDAIMEIAEDDRPTGRLLACISVEGLAPVPAEPHRVLDHARRITSHAVLALAGVVVASDLTAT
jgi:hypothetical protein